MDNMKDSMETGAEGANYKDIVERMSKLYEEMRALVEGMNSDEATEEEVEEMKETYEKKSKAYDSLAIRRDAIADLNVRSASARPTVKVIETRSAATEVRGCSPIIGDQYETRFADYLKNGWKRDYDTRALGAASGANGEQLPSQGFYQQLQKSIELETALYNLVRRIDVGTFTTNFTLEDDFASTEFYTEGWAGEAGSVDEYTPTYTNKTFTGNALRRVIKVSRELVQDAPARGADFSIESIVSNRMGRLFGQSIEYSLWHGNGTNKPQGLKNATLGTATTLATDGVLTPDELISWVYSLPMKYLKSPTCAIVTSQSFLSAVRKLTEKITTTTNGAASAAYLWEPSFQAGTPDRLLGIPVYVSDYVPALADVNNQIHAVIGDFQHMVLAQRTGMSMQVLNELYAGNGQIGYLGEMRLDAKVVRADAFRALKDDGT
jgi:HK97 family phage major capsid protein